MKKIIIYIFFVLTCIFIGMSIPIIYTRLYYHFPKEISQNSYNLFNKASYSFYYNNLNKDEKEVYNEYIKAFLNMNDKILLKKRLTLSSEKKVYEAVSKDHPEIFYIPSRNCRLFLIDNKIDICEFTYPYTKEEINNLTTLFEEKINNIISKAKNYNNDYEKIKYIHDSLIELGEYLEIDSNFLEIAESNDYQSIVSILTTGKTVCCGYTKLFQIIMNRLGYKTISLNDNEYTKDNGHIWNAVFYESEWLYIDVTWDDNEYDQYMYFLNNYDTFYQTHTKITEIPS